MVMRTLARPPAWAGMLRNALRNDDMSRYRKLELSFAFVAVVSLAGLVSSLFYWIEYHHNRKTIGLFDGCLIVALERKSQGWSIYANSSAQLYFWFPRFFRPDPKDLQVLLPLWMPLILAIIAAIFFHRKARAQKPGHCAKCDYDLTGNESGTCPECGTPTC
jgi:hypothetical protein